ncbi:MAG: HD domain-containing protein [Clostridiales bacterium]|nr:HD domain-containing protein [Clostridiales bacterium]
MERLQQQIDFILEIDKLKKVIRQNYLADGSRKESDTDHSWHLAIMCFLLAEYANNDIDVLKTMKMVLIHDIVEIDAGDTYAYDKNASDSDKTERELLAAERIFNILPEDQAKEIRALWDEFEEGNTMEARFANALDKIQPALLNDASGGKSWIEHGVEYSQVLKRNERTSEGSKELWAYIKEIIDKNVVSGKIINK